MHRASPHLALAAALTVVVLARPGLADSRTHVPASSGTSPFASIESARNADDIDDAQALLLRFQLMFDPQSVPAKYRPEDIRPGEPILRCGTPLVREFMTSASLLSPDVRMTIEGYLQTTDEPSTSTLESASGRFVLTYTTSGMNAVDSTDVTPANGIPDFVERVSRYCDEAWSVEIADLGYQAPATEGPPYQVSFESMGFYGYTKVDASSPGGTRIVLNSRFLGFPPNDDPEGRAIGAAKVTIAHEFKHAIQYVTSGWTEGTWLELDATWMEDIVFDEVNDYYNYLPSGSPISAPATSLDAGGGGSYEDCVWQHHLSETFGKSLLLDLWKRRATHLSESMLTSYDAVLADRGSSLEAQWPIFAAWNYLSGSRATAGLTYEEASRYPTAPLQATLSVYPAAAEGSVGRLAANFLSCSAFSGQVGSIRVDFTRAAGSKLALVAIVRTQDGTTRLERIPTESDDTSTLLTTPLEDVRTVGLVVANVSSTGLPQFWSLGVEEVVQLPQPGLKLDTTALATSLATGERRALDLEVTNDGPLGSELSVDAVAMRSLPAPPPSNSVIGSVLAPQNKHYLPGTTSEMAFVVTNNSPDDEWLTGVAMTVPAGVTVIASTDFVGGSEGPLVSDDATGEGATVTWSDQNGNFGNVYGGGEQAMATLTLHFDPALSGELPIDYVLTGDQWGDAPHSVAGRFLLKPPDDSLDITAPGEGTLLAIGSVVDVRWTATGTLREVALELSRDLGATWEMVGTSASDAGSFPWTVSGPAAAQVRLRVRSLDGPVESAVSPLMLYEPVGWLTVSPPSDPLAAGETRHVALTVDATALTEGRYEAVVVLNAQGTQTTRAVPVTVEVVPPTTSGQGPAFAFGVVSNAPNPFNPSTTIVFRIPQEGRVRMDVFNAAGQHVKHLMDDHLTAGEHHRSWSGEDESGRPVASGVYYCRLEMQDQTDVRSMVLVR